MSGTEWVQQIPDDVLERIWAACMQAKDSLDSAASVATWSLSEDVTLGIAREMEAWQQLAALLHREMERREYKPEEVSA